MASVIVAGEAEEEGYSDEYKLEDLEVAGGDYVKQEGVADFRSAWEEMDESTELADSYGLGQRDSMQEAVEAVVAILGMQVAIFACLQLLSFTCQLCAHLGLHTVLCGHVPTCTASCQIGKVVSLTCACRGRLIIALPKTQLAC